MPQRRYASSKEAATYRFEESIGDFVLVVVLGCTHYPFLRPLIQRVAGAQVALIDTGAAVARQAQRVLSREGLLRQDHAHAGTLQWLTSGDRAQLAPVVARLLG